MTRKPDGLTATITSRPRSNDITKQLNVERGQVQLRGKLWNITNVSWCAAEPDVGIMSDYPDGFDLTDADGTLWDFDKDQLTQEEDKTVNDALCELAQEYDGADCD